MTRVVLESPLGAPTRDEIESNKAYARACMRDSLSRGEAPFASHLLYDQPGVLDDTVLEDRSRGIYAGFAWGDVAERCVVYTDRGISAGMRLGIARWEALGLAVEHRSIAWKTDGATEKQK